MMSSNGNMFRVTCLCVGISPVTGEFPLQRPVTRNIVVFIDLRFNKWLGKQSRRRWFETASRSLWRHCNISVLIVYLTFYPLADVTNYLSMQMAYGILVSCELYMSEAPTPKNFMYTAPARQIKVSRINNEVMIHDGVSKWKHFPRYWPFVRGIHRWLVDSPYKGQ